MALGDAYADAADLAARTGRDDDGTFSLLLDAASRQVETFTGRQFNRTEVATERRFRALDPERCPVDDFHTETDLEVIVNDVVWVNDTDYEPRPFDGIVHSQGGWPFSDLMTIGRSWPILRRATIKVSARWGWNAVPEGIMEATLRTARSMIDYFDNTSALITSEAIGGYSISYKVPDFAPLENVPPQMITALPYRRKRFGVA